MNIIFLDIDGVLNSTLYHKNPLYQQQVKALEDPTDRHTRQLLSIDPQAVEVLNGLIEKTGAKIVISSTWRQSNTLEELKAILFERGLKAEIISVTPVLHDFNVRGNEIYKWMYENKDLIGQPYYEFSTYVILDDDSDMLYWQKNNFILVDHYTGITPSTAYKAERILKGLLRI